MRAHRWLAWGLLAAGVAAGAAWAEQERERAGVGRQVRASLRPQMKEHGPHMEELVWTVVLLQRDQTRVLSASIAASEKLARPLPGDLESVNAGVPERFFQLQDDFHARASALHRASKAGNDDEVAAAFGKLAETCVACHARFLE